MTTTRPSVGPGLRERGEVTHLVGTIRGDAFGGSRSSWLPVEVEVVAWEPQAAETTEHAPTPASAVDLAFRGAVWKHNRSDILASYAGLGGLVEEINNGSAEVRWSGGWTMARLRRLAELGERWHLNGMQAGCAHVGKVYETDRYGRRVPSLDQTPACPMTGYRYGSSWLHEVAPPEVLAEVCALTELVIR